MKSPSSYGGNRRCHDFSWSFSQGTLALSLCGRFVWGAWGNAQMEEPTDSVHRRL